MMSRSQKPSRPDSDSEAGSTTHEPPVGVWVTHTPTPDNLTDDGVDTESTGRSSVYEKDGKGSLRDRIKSLIPQSWGGFIHKGAKEDDSVTDSEFHPGGIQILPNGTRVSPPVSPMLDRATWGGSSQGSHAPLLKHSPSASGEDSLLTSIHPAEYYAEKVEVYKQKYSYLKSWPGLLRFLAGIQLLFGGMALACVIAYIQRDSEWSNLYNGATSSGLGVPGYSYTGPMTPFVLAMGGLCWIITFILMVMGMTMYYRTILLDAPWWPLTEAFINVAMFLLYMAAGIVYLNDLNRGGLCYMTLGVNPLMASLCRVEGGQMAGTAFIFINMTLYLGSFVVCLKMWRHEASRRARERGEHEPAAELRRSIPLTPQKVKRISFKDETDLRRGGGGRGAAEDRGNPVSVHRPTELQYTPKAHVVADYIMKYPEITSVEEREKYKAIFNDQYLEYKELHRDVSTSLSKFRELDAAMTRLLRGGTSREERQRIQSIVQKYEEKKNDPAFLEKKERCDYLKAKLSHLKNRIRIFDEETVAGGRT
ncbi:uncharacterized protein V6R79_003006 [Siganus canaliculatus]